MGRWVGGAAGSGAAAALPQARSSLARSSLARSSRALTGLAGLHLEAHSEGVHDRELGEGQGDELGDDGDTHRVALGGALPDAARGAVADVVHVAEDLLHLRRLAGAHHHCIVRTDLPLRYEHVLLGAVDRSAWREEEGHRRRVEEHRYLLVGVDGDEVVHEVERVREVVSPEAVLGVVAAGHLHRVLGRLDKHRVLVEGEGDARLLQVVEELAGAERLREDGRECRLRRAARGRELGRHLRHVRLVENLEEGGGDGELVVAVGLDVGEELAHVEVVHGRQLQHVAAAVLVDVAEVARALRPVGRLDHKVVVVALEVAVDAREGVEDLRAHKARRVVRRVRGVADEHRDAAAQPVVEVVLLGVPVHLGHTRAHRHAIGEARAHLDRRGALARDVARRAQPRQVLALEGVEVGRVAVHDRERLGLARCKGERGGGEGRRRTARRRLGGLENVLERGALRLRLGREEIARHAQRRVGAEEHLLVADDGEQLLGAVLAHRGVVEHRHRKVAILPWRARTQGGERGGRRG